MRAGATFLFLLLIGLADSNTVESLVKARSTHAERDQGVARRRGRRPYNGAQHSGSHDCSFASADSGQARSPVPPGLRGL
jgi:hypothetical protein